MGSLIDCQMIAQIELPDGFIDESISIHVPVTESHTNHLNSQPID